MEKRFVVFVSSTYRDLIEERQAISQALLRHSCFPSQMENWPAMNTAQLDAIRKQIDECDYYLVATAGRYGSVDPGTRLSYTELEYDYALDQGKPIIRLLRRDPFNTLTGDRLEHDPNTREKLQRFRAKMEEKWHVSYWDSPASLMYETFTALHHLISNFPAEGFVRSSSAIKAKEESRQGELAASILSALRKVGVSSQQAIEGLPVAVLQLDGKGRVTSVNPLALTLLPLAKELGTPLVSLVQGVGRPIGEWLAEAMDGCLPNRPQMAHVVGSGETIVQITLGRPPSLEDGGLFAVLTDATELKILEAQSVHNQKMQAIGQLAGGIAHDFNTIVAAISGHCDLLMLRHDQGDPSYGDLVQISQNANRAASLVGQLLGIARKQKLHFETFDLRDTLSELIHLLNRLVGEKVRLRLAHDPGLHRIRADKRQLEQVLMNLVVNARDALVEGGEIRIETENRTLTEPLVRDRAEVPPGDYVLLRVIDEGTGIAPDRLIKIFEPFFTTKRPGEGTGLGLSTAYGIVKQTGGFIFADSTLGVGTTFTLMLPASVVSKD